MSKHDFVNSAEFSSGCQDEHNKNEGGAGLPQAKAAERIAVHSKSGLRWKPLLSTGLDTWAGIIRTFVMSGKSRGRQRFCMSWESGPERSL